MHLCVLMCNVHLVVQSSTPLRALPPCFPSLPTGRICDRHRDIVYTTADNISQIRHTFLYHQSKSPDIWNEVYKLTSMWLCKEITSVYLFVISGTHKNSFECSETQRMLKWGLSIISVISGSIWLPRIWVWMTSKYCAWFEAL